MSEILSIGKHIKIDFYGYNDRWIYEIIGLPTDTDNDETLYRVRVVYCPGESRTTNLIHPSFAFSDEDCLKMDREAKLLKLLKIGFTKEH